MSLSTEAKGGILQNLSVSINSSVEQLREIPNRKDLSEKDKRYLVALHTMIITLGSTATAYVLNLDDSLIVSARAN